jgi:hypothetical protein
LFVILHGDIWFVITAPHYTKIKVRGACSIHILKLKNMRLLRQKLISIISSGNHSGGNWTWERALRHKNTHTLTKHCGTNTIIHICCIHAHSENGRWNTTLSAYCNNEMLFLNELVILAIIQCSIVHFIWCRVGFFAIFVLIYWQIQNLYLFHKH